MLWTLSSVSYKPLSCNRGKHISDEVLVLKVRQDLVDSLHHQLCSPSDLGELERHVKGSRSSNAIGEATTNKANQVRPMVEHDLPACKVESVAYNALDVLAPLVSVRASS